LKDVDSSVHKDVTEERTDGSITISLHNFVGEGIINTECAACFCFRFRVDIAALLKKHCFGLPKFQQDADMWPSIILNTVK
jgi:hypothetical protein